MTYERNREKSEKVSMRSGFRILVVDDEESLRSMLSEVLTDDGYEVTSAENGEQALEIFRKSPFPVVITDILMPGVNGIDLLQEIKKSFPDTQVIIMTSHASLETAINALRSGAYDYLVKPFEDLELISAVVNRAVEKIGLIEKNNELIEKLEKKNRDLERVNDILKEMAIRDGLTGLYNHRYFHEALSMELLRSQRHDHIFSLLFMDLDKFKQYNDSHGHPEGDNLLRTFVQIVKSHLRGSDVIARYGGEEFVIILPETRKDLAVKVAESIRGEVADYPFLGRETQPFGMVTVSIGISTFPEDGSDASSLLRCADRALYGAKQRGRNLVVTT
jgi:diguanylate cyclase (GGDEF)-like protein